MKLQIHFFIINFKQLSPIFLSIIQNLFLEFIITLKTIIIDVLIFLGNGARTSNILLLLRDVIHIIIIGISSNFYTKNSMVCDKLERRNEKFEEKYMVGDFCSEQMIYEEII